MLKIGLLGVGAIGKTIALAIDEKQVHAELVAICDQDRNRAAALSAELKSHPPVATLDQMLERCDVAVEAASQAALAEFVPAALAHGRDFLVMSVGGLLGHDHWLKEAQRRGIKIYVPSGAIAGLDGIKSGSIGRIDQASLTSRKPARALHGTKYVADRGIDLDALGEDTVIFEGSAEEAARAFPATSNVAASLRLAVPRSTPVQVRVVAVPGGTQNVHEIHVAGEFGCLSVKVENVPAKTNPKTSQLAAFSAIATLRNLTQSFLIGT
jgi:aspartate dehydrogenase